MGKAAIIISLANAAAYASAQTLFADGGYQTEQVACITEWSYKEKGTEVDTITDLNGCVSIEDFKPYPYFDNDTDEIANLLEPTNSKTDKRRWCPVLRDVYNPTPQKTETNKFNWGYCLDTATPPPVPTPAPVPAEEEPTPAPVPAEEEPTPAPVPAENEPTPVPTDGEVPTPAPTPKTGPAPTPEPTTPVESSAPVPSPSDDNEVPADSQKSTAVFDDWTMVGLAVAAVLVLVAAVMGTLLVKKMKQDKRDEIIDEDIADNDLEESRDMARS